MHRDELEGWLRLTLTDGVGSDSARKLLASFGLPDTIFGQSTAALAQVVSPAQARALGQRPAQLDATLHATWRWLSEEADASVAGRCITTLGDARYPQALLAMEDPPIALYMLGQLPQPQLPGVRACIAIVGSRNPTPQGSVNARDFAQAMVQAGLTVVSGLALGIDGAAHNGALDAAPHPHGNLPTIAVIGTGVDRVYPKGHRDLARRVASRGLILSEYPVGTPPLAENFPRRNRIISGLSAGTLVVEAALQSGSLITARLAAEQGKDVFAIPGSIHSSLSRGCHALIKQGAKLVESAADVLDELQLPGLEPGHRPPAPGQADPPPAEGALLRCLGHDPVSLDALLARSGLPAADLQAQLALLELEGQVSRLPGGLFQRLFRA